MSRTKSPARSTLSFAVLTAVAASLSGVFAASQSAPAAQATPAADAQGQLATVKQYCATCHSDRVKSGGVSFENLTPAEIPQHADVFEKAVRKLRGRVMPPPGAKQPDAATADALVSWLETTLDRADTGAHIPD